MSDRLRIVPARPPGVSFDVWLGGLTDLQLIEYAVRCARARLRAEQEVGGWSDTFVEVMNALAERRTPDPRAEILGRWFEVWLADEDDQAEHEREYEFRCQFERQLRERGWDL